MKKYIYNKKKVQDVVNRIIAKEEAYENACYDLMSFEDKCHYALEMTPIIHPCISPDRAKRRSLLDALRPELLVRAEREDAFALYVLGCEGADLSAPATDGERQFLERSMRVGCIPAALALIDRFYCGKKRSSPEAESVLSWLSEHITEEAPDEERYGYYSLIGDAGRENELATKLAMNGDYCAAVRLANTPCNIYDSNGESRVFWETVEYLVIKHFYDKGARHLGDTLGMKLINERGCERNLDKIKKIYIDLMLSCKYDRESLVELVSPPHVEMGGDICEAERVCRSLIESGKPSNYWRWILFALLSGDRKRLEDACDEACTSYNGEHSVNISKAYHMLRHAKVSD